MYALSKALAAGVLAAGVMLASAPAQALTVVPLNTSPFSLPANPSGVIPANTMISGSDTWDFSFTTTGGPYKSLMQMQASLVTNGAPQPIAFELFSGAPGSGTFLANSGGTATAAALKTALGAGSYYMQVTESGAPNQLVTGGLTLLSAGIPEPAAWVMTLLGAGAMGTVLRRRRAGALIAA